MTKTKEDLRVALQCAGFDIADTKAAASNVAKKATSDLQDALDALAIITENKDNPQYTAQDIAQLERIISRRITTAITELKSLIIRPD